MVSFFILYLLKNYISEKRLDLFGAMCRQEGRIADVLKELTNYTGIKYEYNEEVTK